MSKVDLAANMKQAQKEGKLGTSTTYKLQEGTNRVRIVDGFLPHNSDFNGKPTFKWLTRVIDRRDGKVKAFFMGHTVYKQLVAFQQDTESGTNFDELPMPYDININATGAGTMEARYTVVASRNSSPLTAQEKEAVAAEDSLDALQDALRSKKPAAVATDTPPPLDPPDFDPDETGIPF